MIAGRNESAITRRLRKWMNWANGLLAPVPDKCLCCGKSARRGANPLSLCAACYDGIPWIRSVRCATCGRSEDCGDCTRRRGTHFVCSRSAVKYDASMKAWLARYKYRGDERLAGLFVEMLSFAYDRLARELSADNRTVHYITYAPLSEERLRERGFNQAEQMAQGVGRKYKVPVVPLLVRTRHTDKQSYKTRAERLGDLQNAFALDRSGLGQIKRPDGSPKLTIVIVDDVYTTGSTLNECAKTLISGLDAAVYGLTWAR